MPDWKEIVGHHLSAALAGVDEPDELLLSSTLRGKGTGQR